VIRADIDALRRMIGAQTTRDDAALMMALDAAGSWVYDRVYPGSVSKPEVAQAVLLMAARLYKRRQSPEGVAGWDEMGSVRIISRDPDVYALLEQHINTYKVLGIA
jgi:hypothetical protein